MKRKTVKKRNPQDATLRNVRAQKRKLAELERQIAEYRHKYDEILAKIKAFKIK